MFDTLLRTNVYGNRWRLVPSLIVALLPLLLIPHSSRPADTPIKTMPPATRKQPVVDTNRGVSVPISSELRHRCLDVLRAGLKSDEFWPAMHAAEALTLAGHGDEVRAALGPRLEPERDDQRRCGLARELVRAGDRHRLAVLFKVLADTASNGRIHAAESLYKLAEIGDGRALRAALAQTGDVRLQLMAAAALARCGNPLAMQRIRELLRTDVDEPRKLAVWITGLLGDQRDVAVLRETLKREQPELPRAFVVHALASLNDADGRAELGRNLASPDAAIRTYAAEFAGYSRALEFRDKLVALVNDPVLDVRARAAQSLVAFSLEPERVSLPASTAAADISVDPFPASAEKPRYSEGSILPLRDGSLLFATTEFLGGGADHATAQIVGRVSRDGGRTWEAARVLQPNVGRQNVMSVTLRRLPSATDEAPLGMFHLVKNSANDLKVYLRISRDETTSFGDPILVTDGPGYHVMNNDRITILKNGRLVCPVSWAADVVKEGHFVSFCYLSDDGGRTWRKGEGQVDQPRRGAMEPEVIELEDGRLLMIVRTQLGHIATSLSSDGGNRWSEPQRLPLTAPEAPATIRRIPATGDLLLIWNNTFAQGAGHGGNRTPLTAAISRDEGKTWSHIRNLETSPDHTFAYTSMLFHKDRALLGYYVRTEKTGWISSRFRSLPVNWFYSDAAP